MVKKLWGAQRVSPDDFGADLTFPPVPSAVGQNETSLPCNLGQLFMVFVNFGDLSI